MRALPKYRRTVELALLTILLLATRIACRSHYLYDVDSVNFALGLRRFDPSAHQPHPPAYFLYVCLGHIANIFFRDVNTALVAIAIAASCGGLLMIHLLTDNWFGRRAALFAGLIFVFSPLVWFHGTVALIYAVEAFFSALAGYLSWRIYRGSENLVVPSAVIVGVAAGFRPSFLLFLGPLLAFSARRFGRERVLVAIGACALTLAAWFFPMIAVSGGFHAYWSSLVSLWRIAPAKQTVFNSNPAISLARVVSVAGIYVLCFGCAALLTFRKTAAVRSLDRQTKIFIWLWIGPGLLFFTLIFLRFVNSGYLLVISPPVFAWLGLRASEWYDGLRYPRNAKITLLAACVMINSLIFLFAPVYSSWTAVRRFEAELTGVLQAIPRAASPADTMIVGFDSHFLGYRHAGYYLPGWYTAQYPQVRLTVGNRIFAMEHGDTHLTEKLPSACFGNFLFFPLPSDDAEYGAYMDRIRARFPKGTLRTVKVGGREFTMGAATDLALLFPANDTARGCVRPR